MAVPFQREIKLGPHKRENSPSITISVFLNRGGPTIDIDTYAAAWDSSLAASITEQDAEAIETALREARAVYRELTEKDAE